MNDAGKKRGIYNLFENNLNAAPEETITLEQWHRDRVAEDLAQVAGEATTRIVPAEPIIDLDYPIGVPGEKLG